MARKIESAAQVLARVKRHRKVKYAACGFIDCESTSETVPIIDGLCPVCRANPERVAAYQERMERERREFDRVNNDLYGAFS